MAKVVFLQNMWYPYMGPMSISSVLKRNGHQCDVFIEQAERNIFEVIHKARPDIIGFSVLTGSHQWALSLAQEIKKRFDVLILFGGIHPTICPEIIENPQVDIICVGEGEYPALELANRIDAKEDYSEIKNLWVKRGKATIKNGIRPLIENLDSLPFIDRMLYYKYPFYFQSQNWDFISAKGCPFECTFCLNHVLNKIEEKRQVVRIKSVDYFINEIKDTKRIYSIKRILFLNDTFNISSKWLFEFLEKYQKEIKLPFSCLLRADLLNEEQIKALKMAGCQTIGFGPEVGDEAVRRKLLKKNITDRRFLEAAEIIHRYKINLVTTNMVGLPGESVEQAFKTVRLNIALKSTVPWSSIILPYPKTQIADYALEKGFLKHSDLENIQPTFYKKSILNTPDIKQLENLHKFFLIAVKFPFSIPLIKVLIKLPPNVIFDGVFLLSSIYYHKKFHQRSLLQVIIAGFKNLNSFKNRKPGKINRRLECVRYGHK